MIRIYFCPPALSCCALILASACNSTSDAPATKDSAFAAKEYTVLPLKHRNTQLHIDYPAVLNADSHTGTAKAYFLVKERAVLEYEWNRQDSTMQELLWQMSNVELMLANGNVYTQRGRVDRTKEQVDPATGLVALKATFSNPTGELRTGQKAVVHLLIPVSNVLLVPQSATYEAQGKRRVYVVGSDNKVVSTEINVLPITAGSSYVVRGGLKMNDRIVIKGVRSLQDGQLIVPRPVPVTADANAF